MSHDPMNEDSLREFIGPEHVHGPWIPIEWEYFGQTSETFYRGKIVAKGKPGRKFLTKVACSSCLEHKVLASAGSDVRTPANHSEGSA